MSDGAKVNRLNLKDVLRELHAREINCGVIPTPPAHIRAFIDLGNPRHEIADFGQVTIGDEDFWAGEPDQIARWMKETADRLLEPPSEKQIEAARRFIER